MWMVRPLVTLSPLSPSGDRAHPETPFKPVAGLFRKDRLVQLSRDRILTTHVGSLPRPPGLLALLEAAERGDAVDEAAFEKRVAEAVREVVARQVAAGIDSVCDGEQSKMSYTFYVRHRLSGIEAVAGSALERPPQTGQHRDILDHPRYAQPLWGQRGGTSWFAPPAGPCCPRPGAPRYPRP